MTFLNQQICGLHNSMQWGLQLIITFTVLLWNANQCKWNEAHHRTSIVTTIVSKFIAWIVGHLLSLCELYDIDQDWLVSQVGPADLDSSQWIHLTVAHQTWVRRGICKSWPESPRCAQKLPVSDGPLSLDNVVFLPSSFVWHKCDSKAWRYLKIFFYISFHE